jgi:hypothetical protein
MTSIRRCSPRRGRRRSPCREKPEKGIGLLWRIARGGAPMYARKLAIAEVQRRIDDWYRP